MSAEFDALLARERHKAYPHAYFINFLFLSYLFYGMAFLLGFPGEESALSYLLEVLIAAATGATVLTRSSGSLGRFIIEKTNRLLCGNPVPLPEGWPFSVSGFLMVLASGLTVALGVHFTDASFRTLFSAEGMAGAQRLFSALFHPNFAILGPVLVAMTETIFMAFMATATAIPIAFVLSFFSSRNLMKGSKSSFAIYHLLRLSFNFSRSIEPIIWAVIFSVWVGIGPFAGMLALMVHSVASLSKLYSEQIESIDQGPLEAIQTTGAGPVQVVWFAVVPQIVLPFLSYTIYRWDINIRMATIIGLVGGGGVGSLLMQYQGLAKWNEVGTIVFVIAIVVWLMDWVSSRLREAIK